MSRKNYASLSRLSIYMMGAKANDLTGGLSYIEYLHNNYEKYHRPV